MTWGMPNYRGQRGSATVLAVAFLGVLLLLGSALGVITAMVRAHRIAQSAADLAALSGAHALEKGQAACASAGAVAARNAARLTSCRVDGFDVLVQVTVTGPHWLGQHSDLQALARAGPG